MTTATHAWEALHRTHTTLTRSLRNTPAFNTVTLHEYDVLDALSHYDDNGVRLNELNEYVTLTQSSLSRLLERLDTRGYLHRWPDPDDGRGTRIRLTDQGWGLYSAITTDHHTHINELLTTALTPAELTTLTTLTNKLRTHTQRKDTP